jgi:hypothetical protein
MALSRITANSIEDGTIVAADIADGSITTAKIADANVTAGKIVSVANTQITGNITSSQIVPDPVFNGNTTVTNIITGAGTVGAPSIAPTGDTNTGIYFPAADNIGFATGGTIRGRWTTDGLCFGSDTAAANALDDYEEGTFTVTDMSGAGLSLTVSQNTYTKIGRMVFATYSVSYPSTASGAEARLSLPFLSGAGGSTQGGMVLEQNQSSSNSISAAVDNSDYLRFLNRGFTSLTNANLSGKQVRFTITYRT